MSWLSRMRSGVPPWPGGGYQTRRAHVSWIVHGHAARSHAALFCALAQDFRAGSVDPPLHAEGPRATAIAMASPQLSRVQLICRAQLLFLLVVCVLGDTFAGRERLEEAQLDGSIALWFCAACRQ